MKEEGRDCGQWTDFNYITDPLCTPPLTHPHSAVPTRSNLPLPGKHVLRRILKYTHNLWSPLQTSRAISFEEMQQIVASKHRDCVLLSTRFSDASELQMSVLNSSGVNLISKAELQEIK